VTGGRIVVVDDDPRIRLLLQVNLEASRFDVVADAGTGDEAVEVAAATHPDVIVLDHLMPDRNGGDAIIDLREVAPDARIVMFSASPAAVATAVASPDLFVSKGDGVAALVAAVRSMFADLP
jgi:DNA-binding NarL/FixJ family response regulator